ncbi:MAG: hypothetical protein SVR04_00185 [Spirochaetota bacterium]|nr:hypothetical protein [Spirochaetota bacterium]
MTREQAQKIIAKYPNAVNFVKRSHLEELSPLLEVHIEVVEVKKADFHPLSGNVYYPKKETTDRFGNAAGISFASVDVGTRREDGAYIGRAVPQEVGPDGKIVQWAPTEYEFDPEIRAEETILQDKYDKYGSEKAKKLLLLGLKKVARRRADTGARAAAIISVIGMPTGLRDLFAKNEPDTATRTFLFSRIIANSKNELVLQRAIDSMFATTGALYGGGAQQIEAPTAVAQPRDVSPEPAATDEVWDDDGGEEELSKRDQMIGTLEAYLNSSVLPEKGRKLVRLAVENPQGYSDADLEDLLTKCRKSAGEEGGAA